MENAEVEILERLLKLTGEALGERGAPEHNAVFDRLYPQFGKAADDQAGYIRQARMIAAAKEDDARNRARHRRADQAAAQGRGPERGGGFAGEREWRAGDRHINDLEADRLGELAKGTQDRCARDLSRPNLGQAIERARDGAYMAKDPRSAGQREAPSRWGWGDGETGREREAREGMAARKRGGESFPVAAGRIFEERTSDSNQAAPSEPYRTPAGQADADGRLVSADSRARDHFSSGEVEAIDPGWLTDKGKREVAAGRRMGLRYR